MRARPGRAPGGVLLLPVTLLCGGCGDRVPDQAGPVPVSATPLPDLVLDGFAAPASALHDPVADVYLVANVDGKATGEDGKGAISRVTPDGVVERQWISSGVHGAVLNAPKGLAIAGDVLFVADLDVVRRFDRKSGAPAGEVPIPGASFLDAVAVAPDGEVWVTDAGIGEDGRPNGNDAIYAIGADGPVRTVVKGKELGQPAGIVALAAGAYVATWGSGEVVQVDGKGRRTPLIKTPQGQLDGLVRLHAGRWLCASFAGNCLYEFDSTGGVQTIAWPDLVGPGSIGFDVARGRVLVPLGAAGRLLVRRL